MACGTGLAHEECNMIFFESDRVGSKADKEAYKRSKNLTYRRKIANQIKSKGK